MNINLEDIFPIGESGIHIKPSHKGLFTNKANAAGESVQSYASRVLANKGSYNSSTIKQAQFAKNASHWHHGAAGMNMGPGNYDQPFIWDNGMNDPEWQDPQKILNNDPQFFTGRPTLQPTSSAPDTSLIDLDQFDNQSKQDKPFRYNGEGVGAAIVGGLSLIDAAIGDPDKKHFRPVQSNRVYNPYPQGTGSQAIMEAGGPSQSKAKEMLRDGTANGKKLSDKQKRYFGWIAGGKKPQGGELGPGDGSTHISQTDPRLTGYDLFNSMIAKQSNPYSAVLDGSGKPSSIYNNLAQSLGEQDARKLFDAAYLNYQNKDYKTLSPEQRLDQFYSTPSNDRALQTLKTNIKTYAANPLYKTTPLDQSSIVGNEITKKNKGGKIGMKSNKKNF